MNELLISSRACLMLLGDSLREQEREGRRVPKYKTMAVESLKAALLPLQSTEPMQPPYWPQWCMANGLDEQETTRRWLSARPPGR